MRSILYTNVYSDGDVQNIFDNIGVIENNEVVHTIKVAPAT